MLCLCFNPKMKKVKNKNFGCRKSILLNKIKKNIPLQRDN